MKIDSNNIPDTVEAAVNQFVESLSEEERKIVNKSEPHEFHFNAGMKMRNEWLLWNADSLIKKDAAKTYSIAHADDISGLIFAWAFAKIKYGSKPFDPLKYCERFYYHWGGKIEALKVGGWIPKE